MLTQPVFVKGRLSPRGVEILRGTFALFFRFLTQVRVSGLENLPPSGGFILALNHLSAIDVPLSFTTMRGRRVVTFAGDTWRRHLFTRWILECVDVIWVNRGAIAPSTMKAALRVLREGAVLGFAPEGTRSRHLHALQEGKTGVAYLAMMARVPIVPAALTHTDKVWSALKRFRRVEVGITFGKPFTLASRDGSITNSLQLQACTDEIMCRIAALLPPEYRGVYAEHPRVKELLILNS